MKASATQRERLLIFASIVLTLGAVTALASGLSTVEIRSSGMLGAGAAQDISNFLDMSTPGSALSALSFLAGFLRILVLVLLPFSIYYFLKSSNARKRVIIQVLYLIGFSYMLLAISRSLGSIVQEPAAPQPSIEPAPSMPMAISEIAEAPAWVVAAVSATLALTALALGWWIVKRLRAREDRIDPQEEARWALDALDDGVELENVIFRAYQRLCIASSRQGLRRRKGMTPKEYEGLLSRSGMPDWALAQLTRIFEKARYGTGQLSGADEQDAVDALQAILGEPA